MAQKSVLVVVLASAAALFAAPAVAGDVSIGINLGTPPPVVVAPAPPVVVAPAPPPAFVLAAPPTLVVVPGTAVYHVPTASFNLFVFGGLYYSFHNDVWFQGPTHNGPWTVIAREAVPRPVLGVPVAYYRVPPGHAKKMKHEAERGCPPGLARQGRC
jgi:hypothetical protein